MHIVIVGTVCIDKNTTEQASYTALGGPAVFMYKIFSQIKGVTVTIVAPYGSDLLPYSQNLPLYPKKPTSEKSIVYENTMAGKKRIQKAYNKTPAKPIVIDTTLQKILKNADILFLSPLIPNYSPHYVKELISFIKKDALKVLLPQGWYRDFTKNHYVIVRKFTEAKDILPLFDIVIVSEQDGKNMLSVAKKWSIDHKIIPVVTLSERGAVAFAEGKPIPLPTKPVAQKDIVDSIGAGDTFSASFGLAYKKTGSLVKAGKFANDTARKRLFSSK